MAFERFKNLSPQQKQKWGNALYLIGGALKGSDTTQDMAVLQQMNAMRKAEADEVGWNKTVDQMALERNPDGTLKYNPNQIAILRTKVGRKAFTDFDIQRQFGTTKPSGKILQVVDQDNVYQRNITLEDYLQNGLNPNEKLTNLPTGTSPAPSKGSDGFDAFKTQYLATNKIIKATSSLAQQFKDDPTAALAVGNTAQFVDSVIQNIDKGLNLMSGKEDRKLYQAAQTNRSEEGTDFGQRIKDASINTGVAESQIRDLAYLFAEGRGQTGRGLSDKDYENALRIVSGGVGAEGKSAVLGDVSNRISEEYRDKLAFEKIYADPSLLEKLNRLPDLETFVNPYESSSSTVEELLKKY